MRVFGATALCCLLVISPMGAPAMACTSFVMDTPDGPVFGANLDLFIPGDGLIFVNRRGVEKESVHAGIGGETENWVSKYGSVTFSLAGREFVWGGMNEAGLVMTSMQLASGDYPKPDERPAVLKGNWGQYVLDTCKSVDEVISVGERLRVQDEGYTDHYLVCDRDGNAAAVEYVDGRFVHYTDDDLAVKAMTNMRYERALYAYEHGGTRWWWSNPGQSAERFAVCQARAESFDAARDTSAVNYAFGTLVNYVAAPHTKWNIVFDIPRREIYYRTDQSPTRKHITLGSFDFSCKAPFLMLDVNAQLEGDVDSAFVPYDPAVNLSVFRTFCNRYGVEITEEGSESLTEFFDGFSCAD